MSVLCVCVRVHQSCDSFSHQSKDLITVYMHTSFFQTDIFV